MKRSRDLLLNCCSCQRKLDRKNAICFPKNRGYPSDYSYFCSKKCKSKFKSERGVIERTSYYLHLPPGCPYSFVCDDGNMRVMFNSK